MVSSSRKSAEAAVAMPKLVAQILEIANDEIENEIFPIYMTVVDRVTHPMF